MTKYIFVTGGVVSGLGKGITSASLGNLLKSRGLTIVNQKLDPYINVDPDTMNPFQHGEVFVTEDGATTDLDLGHYERFTGVNLRKDANVTTGSIYRKVIERERKGDYLGATVQVIPHITDEIKRRIKGISNDVDVQITEIGGTVGDIEILPFLEAARQMRKELGQENVMFIHVTLVPFIGPSTELKTKPTQHSVSMLRGYGISPDIIVLRSDRKLDEDIKNKVSLFCDVSYENVINAPDLDDIYDVPLKMHSEGLDVAVNKRLNLNTEEPELNEWKNMLSLKKESSKDVKIAILGKYFGLPDSYMSVVESLKHACLQNKVNLDLQWIDADNYDAEDISNLDGVVVPGGFGVRGIEGKISAIQYLRENKIPFLGICLGLQCAVIEYARNVCGINEANSSEFSQNTKDFVIDLLPNQDLDKDDVGASMRLGTYPCKITKNTITSEIYKDEVIYERHRHRYEVNNKYREVLEKNGLIFSGLSPDNNLVEMIELKDHPFFVASQFHPEFKSRPWEPAPMFNKFIQSAASSQNTEKTTSTKTKVKD
ncbi:CTP synthase [Candidatus Actinomarina sp.]|nr:CTP synthase [Actinomycetota bacterium]MBT7014135.1 CTP synthase [Actinomycetota bacterium]MDA9592227.1 CTP synthase [Candidatus Actinomarina sp.]